YAPVVMVNWEFFDNQSPESALAMIDDIQAGRDIHPTRGPIVAPTFKENERVLAGFLDGHENEGPSAGRATLLGREIAAANGWTEPVAVEVADEATDTKGEEAK
ncbi:MAG: NADH-quinone oxidoreductase subunit E, partial [Thermobifida sp.]|nr:NADH-quinone oxidoreductase subunit E [Thermobifida sp.]